MQMLDPLKPEDQAAMENPQMLPPLDTSTVFDTQVDPNAQTPATAQETTAATLAAERETNTYGWGQFLTDTTSTEWNTANWLLGETAPAPDLDWEFTDKHFEYAKKQLPEYMWPRLVDAEIKSAAHLSWYIDKLRDEDAAIQRLSTASGWGQAGRMAIGMLDPVEIAAAVGAEAASGGLATPALVAKYGTKIRGLAGGVSNAALGATFNATDERTTNTEFGVGLGVDMVTGYLAGRFVGNFGRDVGKVGEKLRIADPTPASERIAKQTEELSKLREQAEGGSTVGAAQVPNDEFIRPSITLNPEAKQADVPKGAFPGARIGVVGQGVTSDDPIERAIIPHLGEDAVGKTDGSTTPISTHEWARQHHEAQTARWRQALLPAWDEWAKDEKLSYIRRHYRSDEDYNRFSKQVRDYVEDTSPDADSKYAPGVVKAGKRFREIMADHAESINNPGKYDGTTRRSLAGGEKLKPDPYYVPKIADRDNIDRLTAVYGFESLRKLAKAAVTDAMTTQGYQIKQELLDKVADGWLTNISKAKYGMNDDLADVFSGRSKARMYEVLSASGIDEDTVKQIVQAMDAKDSATPRLKHRTPINYKYKMSLVNKKTGEAEDVSIQDFFSDDVDHIMSAYTRRLSGELAFARLRVKDPTQPDSPNFWIDGITSRPEFEEKVLKAIRDSYSRAGRQGVDTAVKRAEYLYNATLGLPQHNLSPELTRKLRRLRDYNYLRLMNNMGITQAIELGRIFSRTSLSAMVKNVPSLKRIIEEGGGSLVLNNKMARELEMWGVTDNDYWVGAFRHRYQEELIGETAQSGPSILAQAGAKYDKVVQKGKDVLANTSLQKPIHSRLQQWAAKASVQWFADNARDPKLFKKWERRLADMGLDADDLKAIRGQIIKHADSPDPEKRTITAMNFENWEPEVRSKFLHAVKRYTSRIVQVNDPGNLPMFFSHPVFQTLAQFRGFTFAAYEKSTLWDLKHRDTQSVLTAAADVAFGAATYALMVHAKAMSRDDREEYLAKELDPAHLAAMGFARSGSASFVPMMVDTGLSFTPAGPVFSSARSSGTPMGALGGSAVVDLGNSLASASSAAIDSLLSGRQLSKQELGTAFRIAPGGNWLPSVGLLNALSDGRPLMAPRKEQ
jgi:hypothetical protein